VGDNLAFETINRAKHDSVVVLEDCKDLKAIVGNPNGFASVLEVCADLDVEFAFHSTTERGRCKLLDSQY
jgi:hypothetical protein